MKGKTQNEAAPRDDVRRETLKEVFNRLRQDHPHAALEVADMLFREDTPTGWAKANAGRYQKINLMKELRERFDLGLQQAKDIADPLYA
jgi:ribosomal protein L7/L12